MNCTFINCFSSWDGAAIFSHSTIYAYDSTFLSCNTTNKTGQEGSVYKVNCINCTFGVYVENTGENNGTEVNGTNPIGNETNIDNNGSEIGNGTGIGGSESGNGTDIGGSGSESGNGTDIGGSGSESGNDADLDGSNEKEDSNSKITKTKMVTKLSASFVTATYGVSKTLVIVLKDGNNHVLKNKKISVKIGSVSKILYTNVNGQVKVLISNLIPKSYTANIKFEGDNDYFASVVKSTVIVKKAKPKIVASKIKYKSSTKIKKYTITLKDNKGKSIKNTGVYLKVKGKLLKVKTNNKGKATFKITNLKKKGNYKAVITYYGNKYYNKIHKNVRMIVK